MRVKIPLVLFLAASLIWMACENQTAPDQLQGLGPSFAGRGPTPDDCDVKGLPVRDYFPKDQSKIVSGLLRDLSDACALESPDAEGIGFQLLALIETWRRIPAEDAEVVYAAGGEIVAGVWVAMEYAGFGCEPDCTTNGPDMLQAADALAPGGAFGVRFGTNMDAVFSMGDDTYDRWGVEPDVNWEDVIPGSKVLIYGAPSSEGELGDTHIGGGFDWTVTPWYTDPWTVADADAYLLVGTCAVPTQTALISHFLAIERLLPQGSPPSYCADDDPLLSAGVAERFTRLASAVLPFWPQPLNAAFAAGVSGSGKAREFSPFSGYDTSPDAKVSISEPFGGPTAVGETICFNPPDCSPFSASWTTAGNSPLATWETVLVYTKDNNGAPVDFGEGFTEPAGSATCEPDGRNRIKCECDAREGIEACAGITLEGLTLNKPGGYQICVEGQPGNPYSSGLNIYACTGTFHISPH